MWNILRLIIIGFLILTLTSSEETTTPDEYPIVIPQPKNAIGGIVAVHAARQHSPYGQGQGQQGHSGWSPDHDVHGHNHGATDAHDHSQKYRDPLKVQRYGFPLHCEEKGDTLYKNGCDYMVTITYDTQGAETYVPVTNDPYGEPHWVNHNQGTAHFKIERVLGKSLNGYVAVGLSKDDVMDDDHIVECVKPRNAAHPRMYHSWSNFHSRPERLPEDSTLIFNKKEKYDSKTRYLVCEFDRPIHYTLDYVKGEGPVKKAVFDLAKEKYFILMAIGELDKPDSDILGPHGPKSFGKVMVFDPDHYNYRSSAHTVKMGTKTQIILIIVSLMSHNF